MVVKDERIRGQGLVTRDVSVYALFGVRLLRNQLVLVHVPRAASKALSARQRRQAVDKQVGGDRRGGRRGLGQERTQALRLAHLGGGDERLRAGLANQLRLGRSGAADRQQGDGIGLVDDAKARVVAAGVALPVGVAGNVASGDGDGVGDAEGVLLAGRRGAVVGVEGHTVGAVLVERHEAAKALPDALALQGLFLWMLVGAAPKGRREEGGCMYEGRTWEMLTTWLAEVTAFAAALEAIVAREDEESSTGSVDGAGGGWRDVVERARAEFPIDADVTLFARFN